jgi:GntR family transcriptional regulator
VRDALAARIAGGEWKPNAAIPNESDLAREFGVSSGTMRKALALMEGERLLTRRPGRGAVVNDQSSEELAERFSNIHASEGERIAGESKMLNIVQASASPAECARLRLRADDKVWRIQRVRLHKGEPFLVEEVAMPAALFPDLGAHEVPNHRIVVLAQQYGILLGRGEERLSIAAASPSVAESLKLKAGSPILVLDRIVHDLDGQAVEWRVGMGHFDDKYYLAEIS